jgi:hypothetical protein
MSDNDATWALQTSDVWESPDGRSIPTLLAAIGQVLAADTAARMARAWEQGHRDVCTDCNCPASRNPYRIP